MTAKRRRSLRTSAFYAQSGRCFYCGLPMWLTAPSELGLKASKARAFQCTAEHLVAQQDGAETCPGTWWPRIAGATRGGTSGRDQPLPLKRSGRWFRRGWQWGDGGPDCHQGLHVLPYGQLN